MAYHNVRFPTEISFGSIGGPRRKVEIVQLASLHEKRTSKWSNSMRRYNVATGIKSNAWLYELISFFEAREGMLHSFRFKDWSDYKSYHPNDHLGEAQIGRGDEVRTQFQLCKFYQSGDEIYRREITKPVASSLIVHIDAAYQEIGKDFILDETNGTINFIEPPSQGAPILTRFEFDVCVRFDCEQLDVAMHQIEAGEVSDIPLIEVIK